jgi:hypothetical protein
MTKTVSATETGYISTAGARPLWSTSSKPNNRYNWKRGLETCPQKKYPKIIALGYFYALGRELILVLGY